MSSDRKSRLSQGHWSLKWPAATRIRATVRYAAAMQDGLLADCPGGSAATAVAAPRPPRGAAASIALAGLLSAPVRPARVLGASAAAIYLGLDDRGREPTVVAVVAFDAVRLPLALVLAGRLPAVDTAASGSVGGGGVTIGSLRLRPSRWFDPRPRLAGPSQPGPTAEAARLLAELRADASGLPGVQVDAVSTGLVGGDPGPALDLIGLGPGLTPAGDDVVAGVFAAIALWGRLNVGAVEAVLSHAASATSSLSSSLLRCAAAGQVIPQAAAVLVALGGLGMLRPALEDLLGVGATSGVALALGLVAGARAVLATPAGQIR